jgi:hypothetical protein
MKTVRSAILFAAAASTASWPATARAEPQLYPIAQALSSPEARAKLNPSVKLFFGRRHPPVAVTIGVWPSNKRANIFGRSNQLACDYSLLSAVLSLQGRAKHEQANAVVDIESTYENVPTISEAEYVCDVGPFRVGVALKGRVVSLGRRQ